MDACDAGDAGETCGTRDTLAIMNGFISTYEISRARMMQSFDGLSSAQLSWRPHKDALSIFEMFMHVAGGDTFMLLRLQGKEPSEYEKKIELCARSKVVNDDPFPFSDEEACQETLVRALDHTYAIAYAMMKDCDAWEGKSAETVLGPVAEAAGVFARISQHPAYHTGQAWIYRNHPDFPMN